MNLYYIYTTLHYEVVFYTVSILGLYPGLHGYTGAGGSHPKRVQPPVVGGVGGVSHPFHGDPISKKNFENSRFTSMQS